MEIIEAILLLVLYFVPTILAKKLHVKDASSISYVNLVFGWTVVGWILALMWVITEWAQHPPDYEPENTTEKSSDKKDHQT
jgi:Superinfection immunity protein